MPPAVLLITPSANQDGAERLLLNLLATAVKWAADGNVPVDDNVWKRAKSVLAQPVGSTRRDEAGEAVIDLLHGFKVPVLVLFGKLKVTAARK